MAEAQRSEVPFPEAEGVGREQGEADFSIMAGDESEQFMQKIVKDKNKQGYNCVVIRTRHKAAWFLTAEHYRYLDRDYWIYTQKYGAEMAVENLGDDGWGNWRSRGLNWVRYGNVHHFYADFDEMSLGTPNEFRSNCYTYPHRKAFENACDGDIDGPIRSQPIKHGCLRSQLSKLFSGCWRGCCKRAAAELS